MKVHLISNSKSGSGEGKNIAALIQEACDAKGYQMITYAAASASEFNKNIERAIDSAKHGNEMILAAGGDGTIRAVSEKLLNTSIPLGIIPVGTFNYFSKEHGIPKSTSEAIQIALNNVATPVQIAKLNDHVFINNASIGLYVKTIKERERWTDVLGRSRFVAAASTIYSFFTPQRLLKFNIEHSGSTSTRTISTPLIFICNNQAQLKDLALIQEWKSLQNEVSVIYLRPVNKKQLVSLLFRGVTKTLLKEKKLEQFYCSSLSIETLKKTYDVSLDAEIFHLTAPFKIEVFPHGLNLIKPMESHESS